MAQQRVSFRRVAHSLRPPHKIAGVNLVTQDFPIISDRSRSMVSPLDLSYPTAVRPLQLPCDDHPVHRGGQRDIRYLTLPI
jgi:hypothetical protein